MSYADTVVRNALLTEVDALRSMLPDTENVKRNLAAIEAKSPVDKMGETELRSFVNLLARSVA